jgi:(2R)-sulfolactate sulfo-lyase subunit alpha
LTSERVPSFLAHNEGDSVAVAMRDLSPGPVEGGYLVGPESIIIELQEPVPLGHKFALHDISEGDEIVEYGVRVALASKPISAGQYVHVHNVRSIRWHTSVAS